MHPVSNTISAIQTAIIARKLNVIVQNTKFILNILRTLQKLGFLRGFIVKNKKQIEVLLKYKGRGPAIKKIKVLSRPGKRLYFKKNDLMVKSKKTDLGHYVLTTDVGILADKELFSHNVGGEAVLRIH